MLPHLSGTWVRVLADVRRWSWSVNSCRMLVAEQAPQLLTRRPHAAVMQLGRSGVTALWATQRQHCRGQADSIGRAARLSRGCSSQLDSARHVVAGVLPTAEAGSLPQAWLAHESAPGVYVSAVPLAPSGSCFPALHEPSGEGMGLRRTAARMPEAEAP